MQGVIDRGKADGAKRQNFHPNLQDSRPKNGPEEGLFRDFPFEKKIEQRLDHSLQDLEVQAASLLFRQGLFLLPS